MQPQNNDRITIEKRLTFGDIQLKEDSLFSFLYSSDTFENNAKITLKSVVERGANPTDIATLRELVKYPSVYDDNAVFLGEFDLLLRAKFQQLPFLAVWNEVTEEAARGASVNNINTLFVSFALNKETTSTRRATEESIKNVLNKADNSYKVKFIPVVEKQVRCTIKAKVSRMFGQSETISQIKALLVKHYGRGAFSVKQGKVSIKHKVVSDLLRTNIHALADQQSDLSVTIQEETTKNPEDFLYFTERNISVTLDYNNYETNVWG